jgi:SAM-dependent methyltransferase
LAVEITLRDEIFRLELPPPGIAPGWITVVDAYTGNPRVRRRPLPAGILPSGTEAGDGVDNVEYWDSKFRSGSAMIEWDKNWRPALKLQEAVEQGVIQPGRVIELGCGSGNDAIYLARQGFEVTAVDLAPTALSLAARKAEQAGVQVNWVLADALALPELGSFDFIFDRGCYHWVRHVNAAAYVESLRRLSRPGARCLILSFNRDGPGGVREHQMRDDFSALFDFERLEEGGIENRLGDVSDSWSLMLRRRASE